MQNFNSNWQFRLDDGSWQPVQIPHDWLISDTKNLYKSGVGQYRKIFVLENVNDQKFYLRFDGIYMDTTLYVNGKQAGEWKNGYTTFTQEISDFVHEGENEVMVSVNHQSPNTRWYSGAGIYRDCWLIQKNAAHFAIDGIYVTPRLVDKNNPVDPKIGSTEIWNVEVDAEVISDVPYDVRHEIIGVSGLTVQDPTRWDITNPHCYTLESTLLVNGVITDTVQTRFGFRTISYHTTDGFFLNGRRVELFGVCQHHDLGSLGAAMNKDALRRQMQLLRSMGVNAIRTAHNPPAQVFMELADEMGFVVMTEFTDMWKRGKTKYDYARFFDDWAERDVAAWVRRDRNCPSIIMWSIGNEIPDTHANFEDGSATMKRLMNLVKTHDPKGHAPATLSSNYMAWENTQKCADIIKLIGYNYAEYLYHQHREANPSWIIYGGETSSTVQSRGIYHFPLRRPILSDDDLQCSSLGNSTVSWGAKSSEACITDHRDATFSLGQFLWTGTDYIGEPTPYHTKNSYFGQIDTAGFPKDAYYIYKSAWTNVKDEPVLHLYPHWDWSPGQPIDVRIATNAPKVELFLNGKPLGTREIDHARDLKIVADYIVPYEPGVLKAVAYDESGNVISETERRSFSDAVKLGLTHEKVGELTFTTIQALDEIDNPVENATNRVKVTVKNGELLGLDNGDSSDFDQYQGVDNRRLFSGKLLAITKGESPEICAEFDWSDTPIRKIELHCNGFEVTAKTYPANATFTGIEWRLANEAGIDSPLGRLEIADPGRVQDPPLRNANTLRRGDPCGRLQSTIIPKGDGTVYIRASARNGQEHQALISLYPIEITGYGIPFLDPYSFISGGLYNRSNHPMDNGNARGVATPRGKESHVGFADLDFGKFGSDEFTIGLFPLTPEPFPIEIWQGMPNEPDVEKLTTVTYDQGSKWNTYIDVTYKLPKRLTGVQTLCFVVHLKTHISGFKFKGKAISQVPFAAHDSIYGDNFAIHGDAVEGIGNNVSILFDKMNFETPAEKVTFRWRSSQDKNTIKLVFTSESGTEITNMLTLPASPEYSVTTLTLDAQLCGNGSLSFIFLPGAEIDLEWFKFE